MLLLAAWCHPAAAHAVLTRSEPADGAMLAAAPGRLVLLFNEPVSPLVLILVGPEGVLRPMTRHRTDGTELSADLPSALPQGTYVFRWRVISADGHPASGSVLFAVGTPSAIPAALAAENIDWLVRGAIWFARLALYAGLFAGAGAAAFALVIAPLPPLAIRVAVALTLAGLASAPVSIGLQGLDALEAPLTMLAQPIVWTTGAEGSFGRAMLFAGAALIAALAALIIRRPVAAKLLALSSLILTGAVFSVSGHASTAEPQGLMPLVVFLHTTAAACWLGALMPLGFILAGAEGGAVAALHRFSRLIPFALHVLVGTGLVLAIVQIVTPAGLWATSYGRILVLKLTILVLLLTLAALNRWRYTAGAENGDPLAMRRLVWSIALEIVLGLAILGTVALWRFTPPPRAIAAADAKPVLMRVHTAEAMADVEINPGRAGGQRSNRHHDRRLRTARCQRGKAHAPQSLGRAGPRKPGDSTWRTGALDIPVPGRWTVRIDIDAGQGGSFRLEGSIDVRP